MRSSTVLLFFVFLLISSICVAQAAGHIYSIKLRVQFKDTAVFCDCPQDDHAQDNGGQADCNSLSDVMINMYNDTNLIHTFNTDQTGYIPWFDIQEGKYKLVFHQKNYNEASILVDFTATDIRNSIRSLSGNPIHFKNDGNAYFICIILDGKGNTHGVRIVPKKN
ncbi:MAG TPA: hypothetical protein VK783_08135 [Bacteroidia bacterium]|jgi:hypothetical protein|nr:hypothetical protein [Bacteroidia bacterium]